MDRRLAGITCLIGVYKCNNCGESHPFSEKIPSEKVRRFYCPHFNLIIMFVYSNGLKFHVKTSCNKCYKEYSSDLKLGGLDINHHLIDEDNYTSFCCGNKIEVFLSLSKDYIDANDQNNNNNPFANNNKNNNNNNNNNNNMLNYNNGFNNNNSNNSFNNNFCNFNPMMNNGMNMNMNMFNQNMNFFNPMSLMSMNNNNNFMNNFNNNNFNNNNFNKNNFNNNNYNNNFNNNNNMNFNNNISNIKFDSSNIIEFGKKKKLVNFLVESTNKNYKIFTSPNLKLKNVLSDLLNQFPEIIYSNNRLELNGVNINPESSLSSCNLNENSVIIIKN